jgi:amino-acid N-acetyltransferase
MNIRIALPKDSKKIKALIARHPERLIQTNLPKLKDFFVAEKDGEIIACCALQVYSKRMAEIRSLVVEQHYWRQGIATKLIKECLKKAKKLKIYEVLSVTSSVLLFENQGFKMFNDEKYALLKMMGV